MIKCNKYVYKIDNELTSVFHRYRHWVYESIKLGTPNNRLIF